MKTRVSLKCFVSYYLWKLFVDFNLAHTPSNLCALTFLVIVGLFIPF